VSGEEDLVWLRAIAVRSVEVIRENQHASGAYLASPNFPVYRYSWLRDGAFIADAMSRAGYVESAESFFAWCARVVCDRLAQIDDLIARRRDGQPIAGTAFLHTRFTVDGDETGEDWTDFQLDGYGAWLWSLDAHRRRHDRSIEPFLGGAVASARYVAAFWDHPSYDWWEEHLHERHTSTMAALFAGLAAAASWDEVDPVDRAAFASAAAAIRATVRADAQRLDHLPKWLGSDSVDASLLATGVPFGLIEPEDPLMAATVEEIEATLVLDGGVYRYLDDTYFGGGRWLLLAAFLGWHLASVGRTDDAWRELRWIARQATPAGDLPEQVLDRPLAPASVAEWVDRWGPVATPLLWSHAMYLTLALELGAVAPVDIGPGQSLGESVLA
jgi:GH15 family glucan-1,4-alpha-glucosidase